MREGEIREPAPGTRATATLTVGPSDLASAVGLEPRDEFPGVLATARLVALMEIAASRILRPHLSPGELSVGVSLDIRHSAATPPGATVTATATFVRKEGKFFLFEVVAADEAGEIGSGTHRRAAVASERLLARARSRRG
ncbi:MAG: thioesterase family protein [Thermoanaerobaculia bacterium]